MTILQSSTDNPEGIAARCRDAISASGLNQRQVAQQIGLDPTALSKALRGARRLRQQEVVAIAGVCRVTQRYLLTGAGRVPAGLARVQEGQLHRRADVLDSDARRRQILEATARLIARRGFHHVRVADIASECGTSTGTVHYHFPAKDDALREALSFYANRFQDRLATELADTDDVCERLRRLIEIQLPLEPDDVDEWSVWVQSWNEALLQPSLRAGQRTVYSRWRRTVLELILAAQEVGLARDANADALTSRFTSMVDGLALQVLVGSSDMSIDRMRQTLLDAFEPHITLRSS